MTAVNGSSPRPPSTRPAAPGQIGPDQARISFRQPVHSGGHVDAVWWPRTRDLAVELPPLLDVLWTASRDVNRITYSFSAWDATPRRMLVEGRTVRVGGFVTGDPLMVSLSDPWGRERIDVLVLAPDTPPAVAEHAFRLVADGGGTDHAAELLRRARVAAGAEPATVTGS